MAGKKTNKKQTKGKISRFQPGNKVGNRFKPGESGNPKGRPLGVSLTRILREKLEKGKDGEKTAKALIDKAIAMAKKGDFRFFKEIYERIDGKVLDVIKADLGGLEVIVKVPHAKVIDSND